MNAKKIAVSLLTAAMLTGCSAGSASNASASASNNHIDELKMQFVPSRDAELILQGTAELPDLLQAEMAQRGYDIGKISISVSAGSDYNVAGEALSSGAVDVAWLPAATYVTYADGVSLALTATRDELSNDSEDPRTWNGVENATTRVEGKPVTYYRGLLYVGPSEKGKKIAAKVDAGEELTWEDLADLSWAIGSTTSSSGYVYPTLWLMEKYGKTIADLPTTTKLSYPQAFQQAAAGKIDVVLCYADGRMDYEENWTKPVDENEEEVTAKSGFGRTESIYDEMRVFAVTDKIFNDTVCLTMDPDKGHEVVATDGFKKAFQESMIAISQTEKGKEIISVYSHTGYVEADEANYQSLIDGMNAVKN